MSSRPAKWNYIVNSKIAITRWRLQRKKKQKTKVKNRPVEEGGCEWAVEPALRGSTGTKRNSLGA